MPNDLSKVSEPLSALHRSLSLTTTLMTQQECDNSRGRAGSESEGV
jgi:hypothetical protein